MMFARDLNGLPQVTIYQGGVEDIFCESMSEKGLEVERATIPISLDLLEDENKLRNPNEYAVKVASLSSTSLPRF